MCLISLTLLTILAYILAKIVQKFMHWNDDYWPRLGVPLILSSEFGSFWEIFSGQKTIQDLDHFYYTKYPQQPFIGYMEVRSPALMIRDPDLIHQILVQDFTHFVNRPGNNRLEYAGMDQCLFNLTGSKWMGMRLFMSPLTRSVVVKKIFQHFTKSAENLVTFLSQKNSNPTPSPLDPTQNESSKKTNDIVIPLGDCFERYTMDIIASTVFGIDGHCLEDHGEDPVFIKMAQKFSTKTPFTWLKFIFTLFFPNIAKLLRVSLLNPEASKFFTQIIKNSLQHTRQMGDVEKTPFNFLHILINVNKEVPTTNERNEREKNYLDSFEQGDAQLWPSFVGQNFQPMTNKQVVDNSLGFFQTAFHTIHTILSFTAYYLALCPKFQTKLRQEVGDFLTQNEEREITHEMVCDMKFLDMFLCEVLRLHPPSTKIERKVTKPYQIPGTTIFLRVGTTIGIPVMALHHDPKHFPNPEKFDPERFSSTNNPMRHHHPYAWTPFGHGPRSCMGMRFAMTAIKTAIIYLVQNFKILPCPHTFLPVRTEIGMTGIHKPAKEVKILLRPHDSPYIG